MGKIKRKAKEETVSFHSHLASFLRFMAANLSFTQLVTWVKPLAPLPELMDRKKRDIMERKGDKEDENKRQKQQKESSAAAL